MTQTTITFYHSMVCPRCHVSGLLLSRVLREYPHITVNKVELLTNMERSRQDGVRSIPALVAGDKKLTGVILTGKRIRQFLDSLSTAPVRAAK